MIVRARARVGARGRVGIRISVEVRARVKVRQREGRSLTKLRQVRAEEAGHEAREGDAKLKVNELPRVDGARLVEVGMCERTESNEQVRRREAAEAGSEDVAIVGAGDFGRVEVDGSRLDYFEADVFSLTVAVEPQHQRITAGRLGM